MKLGTLVFLLCTAAWADGPTIRTVAGPADGPPVWMPQAVAVDRAGDLYIATFLGPVFRVSPEGAISTAVAQPWFTGFPCSHWTGIAVDDRGSIYLSDFGCHEVVRYDRDGTRSVIAGPAEVRQPHGLALDAAGNLYIADTYRQVIRVVWR
jgi:DNA-binding beta-propeller fold protein YncE